MITPAEWTEHCARVTRMMQTNVAAFLTPLSMSEEFGSGTAWGSGTYITGPDQTWILTAAHVVDNVPLNGRLAHLPSPGGQYSASLGKPVIAPWPIDAAALPVYPRAEFMPAPDRIVPADRISAAFEAQKEELLFWMGFPGYRAERNDPRLPDKLRVSMYGQLSTPMQPMLAQATDASSISASNFDPRRHVAVHYPETATRERDGQLVALPNAAGMSGSALWDTKFLACCLQGKPWDPSMSKICGVVWAVLDKPEVVFVTRIEDVRAALPGVF